jgi:MGT family glycosyltransferase
MTTWDGGGNLPAVLTVARRLLARGHDVRVMVDTAARLEVEAAGAEHVSWTLGVDRQDRSVESDPMRDWEATDPLEGFGRLRDAIMCGPARGYALDVAAELERRPADLVVTSEMLFGVQAACEALGQPVAILTTNLWTLPRAGMPPFGPGLLPARDADEERMHEQIRAATIAALDLGLPGVNAARAAFGLTPLAHVADQTEAAAAILIGTSAHFDFEGPPLPERMCYAGPLLDQPTWVSPWAEPEGEGPLVAVGFSTTFQDQRDPIQRTMDALGQLPVRGLVTLGPALEGAQLRVPRNVTVVASAPHDAVLDRAAALVTHGGHGTLMRALVRGVPSLVLPMGRDQNDNAARVIHHGVGLSLDVGAPSQMIRSAVQRLLDDPSFGDAARRLADRMATERLADPAVTRLEALAAGFAPTLVRSEAA